MESDAPTSLSDTLHRVDVLTLGHGVRRTDITVRHSIPCGCSDVGSWGQAHQHYCPVSQPYGCSDIGSCSQTHRHHCQTTYIPSGCWLLTLGHGVSHTTLLPDNSMDVLTLGRAVKHTDIIVRQLLPCGCRLLTLGHGVRHTDITASSNNLYRVDVGF